MSTNIMRQIVLDTETTGIDKIGIHYEGHRIIEIGAVEIINRHITEKYFHVYLKPNRLIDPEAFYVHEISDEFLIDKPVFADVADEFFRFIYGSELIIHNASFDIGFIDYEFSMLKRGINKVNTFCKVTDSLCLARKIFPGKRNNLDALFARYMGNNSQRTLHNALLDAKMLAKIFLHMTGGQTSMRFMLDNKYEKMHVKRNLKKHSVKCAHKFLKIIHASDEELIAHEHYLDLVEKNAGHCLWRNT